MEYTEFKIVWTSTFKEELESIYRYLSLKLKNPIISEKFYTEIMGSLDSLRIFPYRNAILFIQSSRNQIPIRKLKTKNYNIIYYINSNQTTIYILHIFHKTQNYFNLL